MSKLDIGVGDEFPLESGPLGEGRDDGHRGRHGRHGHHHHGHHGGHHHGHHHGRGRGRGLGRLAVLLVIGGLVALVVQHQLTAAMAFGMVGVGAGLLVLSFLVHVIWHWRMHRRLQQQVS